VDFGPTFSQKVVFGPTFSQKVVFGPTFFQKVVKRLWLKKGYKLFSLYILTIPYHTDGTRNARD
jgi:hypothetical protein